MRVALIIAASVFALATAATAAADYTGPFYTCTFTGDTGSGQTVTVTRPHVGQWHAAQLVKAGWVCTLNGETVPFVAAPSSSFMCRILDANEQPQAILDSEILSTDPGTRSLANGWEPAAYDHGRFVCEPVANPTAWTDDSLSIYDAPNTAYANPVA